MNETTKNFWEAWNSQVWEEPMPVFYRLYYNLDGTPVCYTMEDLPGTYIEIDCETYTISRPNVRVVDGKIKILKESDTVSKLQPSSTEGTACNPKDVCVIVDVNQPHNKWNIKTNELD